MNLLIVGGTLHQFSGNDRLAGRAVWSIGPDASAAIFSEPFRRPQKQSSSCWIGSVMRL